MKFPTSERVLPALVLSDAERENFAKMARALVDTTVAEQLEYDRVYQRQVNPEQWKAVKRREALTVYKERKITRPSAMGGPQRDWKVPRLLMVGSIVGTLEDVMYGVATFDAASMLLKTTYTHDELVDGEILNQIQGPTPEDPFHFLGLKWIVKGNPAAVSKIVHPRDLVFLETTGIDTRWNGERYGYHLMHSVNLPGCEPLPSKSGLLRGLVSSCIVFKQRLDDASTIDVYMKAKFEPNGKVGESVAVHSAANGLIYCWRSVYCAQHKKLAWLLSSQSSSTSAMSSSSASEKACSTCGKSGRAYRQLTACALCHRRLCSTCRIAKKISYVASRRGKSILRHALPFCTSCVTRASQTSALKIASDEVRSGRWDVHCAVPDSTVGSGLAARFASLQLRDESIDTNSFVSESESEREESLEGDWGARTVTFATSEGSILESPRHSPAKARQHRRLPASSEMSVSASEHGSEDHAFVDPRTRTHGANQLFHAQPAGTSAPTPAAPAHGVAPIDPHQQLLYLQIAQLRDAAENIYQIAMANAAAMHSTAAAVPVSRASDEATTTPSRRVVREARTVG